MQDPTEPGERSPARRTCRSFRSPDCQGGICLPDGETRARWFRGQREARPGVFRSGLAGTYPAWDQYWDVGRSSQRKHRSVTVFRGRSFVNDNDNYGITCFST